MEDIKDYEDEQMQDQEDEQELEEQEEDEVSKLANLNQIYANKIQSQAAEFENFRNRTSKEMSQIYDNGVRDTVLALLPIVDNFERAMAGEADKSGGLYKGIEMIHFQLVGALEGLGVSKIAAQGEKFDPNLHSAVSHVDDENYGENEIAAELACGYIYKDKVIRHSMVTVAN